MGIEIPCCEDGVDEVFEVLYRQKAKKTSEYQGNDTTVTVTKSKSNSSTTQSTTLSLNNYNNFNLSLSDATLQLKTLKLWAEEGLITEDEYKMKKEKVLEGMSGNKV